MDGLLWALGLPFPMIAITTTSSGLLAVAVKGPFVCDLWFAVTCVVAGKPPHVGLPYLTSVLHVMWILQRRAAQMQVVVVNCIMCGTHHNKMCGACDAAVHTSDSV